MAGFDSTPAGWFSSDRRPVTGDGFSATIGRSGVCFEELKIRLPSVAKNDFLDPIDADFDGLKREA